MPLLKSMFPLLPARSSYVALQDQGSPESVRMDEAGREWEMHKRVKIN